MYFLEGNKKAEKDFLQVTINLFLKICKKKKVVSHLSLLLVYNVFISFDKPFLRA